MVCLWCGRTVARAGGQSVYGHVITKFSWMGRLLHFLTHGAPLHALQARAPLLVLSTINRRLFLLCPNRRYSDTLHLCTHLWTDRIKAMSHGFSGGETNDKMCQYKKLIAFTFVLKLNSKKRKVLNLISKMKTANYGWKQSFGLH